MTVPFYNVTNGDRFMAEAPNLLRSERTVQLRPDPGYGGLQDVWTLP